MSSGRFKKNLRQNQKENSLILSNFKQKVGELVDMKRKESAKN